MFLPARHSKQWRIILETIKAITSSVSSLSTVLSYLVFSHWLLQILVGSQTYRVDATADCLASADTKVPEMALDIFGRVHSELRA